jgi:hypothetical protein
MQVVMFQALWDIRRHPEIPIMHELFYNNLFCRVADVVSERYKIPMRYRSLNDLELWDSNLKLWRKVAPAAMAPMGNAQLTGIALICGKPSDLMNRCLASPRDKYADKVIKEASLRNWNIEEAGAWPSGLPDKDQILKEQMDMILEAWRRAFGPIEYEIGEYTEGEEREGEAIYRFFTSEENIFARSPEKKFAEIPEGTSLGKHSEKVIGGPLIRAYVLRRGDMIEDVMLSGTVHLAPAETFEEIEKELKGCKMDESIIRERVEAAWKRLNAALGMGSASLVAETIVKACKEAK